MLSPRAASLLFLIITAPAYADEPAMVSKIMSGDEIVLADGRTVKFAGIEATAPEAQTFLQANVAGHAVVLQNAAPDRYGRIAALVLVEGQTQLLQETMLVNGLAFVYPAAGDGPQLDDMLKAEQEARHDNRGFWATHPDTSADDAEKLYGKYGFVTGTVVKAERVKNKLYLNFGPDWHTCFTVEVAAHDLRAFKNAGIDLLSWQGKKVRVRGWVKHEFGPRITITDPHQIELLP
jgi:endonuclease YncB( thermonuclease family)